MEAVSGPHPAARLSNLPISIVMLAGVRCAREVEIEGLNKEALSSIQCD